jgi:hypothetical protein
MRKIILLILFVISIYANEIQVFNSNSMHIELDSKSKITTIYNGSLEDFYKNSKEIIESKVVTSAIMNGMHSAAMTSNSTGNLYNGSNIDINQITAGGVGALAGYALGSGVTWVISDNEYISVSVVVNSKGEPTMIKTLIVANNSISNEEVSDIGKKALKKLINKTSL